MTITREELEAANASWGCNCGPAALAAICGLTLDEVRRHFEVDRPFPGYTNPTMMFSALRSTGRRHVNLRTVIDTEHPWPGYGICRVQWEGPWMAPNVPAGARYQRTHWVGVSQGTGSRGQHLIDIFDVNAVGDGGPIADGWGPLEWWSSYLVPLLTSDIKRATGGWHITHAIEIERPAGVRS